MGALRRRAAITTLAAALAGAASQARADQPSGFVCLGEAGAVARGLSVAELEEERDKRIADLDANRIPLASRAHVECVVAELMKRLGDSRAATYFARAIADNPGDPAYELWYGRYFYWRGAALPLWGDAEAHALAALAKQDRFHGETQVGSTDAVLRDWARWNLSQLYQQDGLPLLPYGAKAYPYAVRSPWAPQLTLMALAAGGSDTVDFWDFADTRRFTSEAQLAAVRTGVAALPEPELATIARASLRYDARARLRLRQAWLGALDVGARKATFYDSQIISFAAPTTFGDIDLSEIGAELQRPFDLYPLFDLTLDAQYIRQRLVGAVETLPDLAQLLNVYAFTAAVSRYVGPDKLTASGSYVWIDIPDLTSGALDQRGRARVIRTASVDYAFYRPLALPQLQAGTFTLKRTQSRGWHVFALGILDEEQFGTTVVTRRNAALGTAYKGWQAWDLLLSETVLDAATTTLDFAQPALDNRQLRTTVRALVRLVDEDANPAPPESPVASLSLAFPVRHDAALAGPASFENVRGGVELWAKLWSSRLRGTSFLVDAGVELQWFYRLDKVLPVAHVDVRMGWPSGGYVPAYF